MYGKIGVVAMLDDGTSREILLSPEQRDKVLQLLWQMFPNRPLPVSETELPLEPLKCDVSKQLRKRMRGQGKGRV